MNIWSVVDLTVPAWAVSADDPSHQAVKTRCGMPWVWEQRWLVKNTKGVHVLLSMTLTVTEGHKQRCNITDVHK